LEGGAGAPLELGRPPGAGGAALVP
jgi:hypothetical protein